MFECMPTLKFSLSCQKNSSYFPSFTNSHSKADQGGVQLALLQHHVKFCLELLKSLRKWSQQVCLQWPCDPSQGQGHWKWYKMVEVNSTHKHGRYERLVNTLHVMSTAKVFALAHKTASWPSGWTQLITQIHMLLTWTANAQTIHIPHTYWISL